MKKLNEVYKCEICGNIVELTLGVEKNGQIKN